MPEIRHDLDGERLIDVGTSEIWLVFHGKRHLVGGGDVYDSLFKERERLITAVEIETVELGDALGTGSCLVRPQGSHPIYLVAGSDAHIRRHLIPSYECLLCFGFDLAKTYDVPELLVRALEEGEPLVASERRG